MQAGAARKISCASEADQPLGFLKALTPAQKRGATGRRRQPARFIPRAGSSVPALLLNGRQMYLVLVRLAVR